MSVSTHVSRSLDKALADLYSKLDRTPVSSIDARRNLERMIKALEASITDRAERVLALYCSGGDVPLH
jgi:hypothetical protein